MACWQHDGQACGDTFRFWPGYLEAYGLYDAYHVVDAFGNTVFGLTGASATQPGGGVDVDFTSQLLDGGSPQGYALDVDWPTGPSQPSGALPVTLSVDVPADSAGDWPAGTVTRAVTLDFQGGETRMLIQKQPYDARFAADDGAMPMTVAPGAGEGGLPASPAGDTPRLVLLAVRGTQVPWAIVGGSDEPSLEPDKVYRTQLGTWQKVQASPGSQDVVLDTQPGGTFRLSLVDGSFNVVPETAFRVHRCPRGEHLTAESPAPEPCTLGPVDSEGQTGILPSLALNEAGGARGYLGIELTRAPVDPGTYYVLVESTGATPYRIRQGADLVRRNGQESEYLGAYMLCSVAGGEFLDENFQRFPDGVISVPAPTRIHLRTSASQGEPLLVDVTSLGSDSQVVGTLAGLGLTSLGRSGWAIGSFVALPPSFVPAPENEATLRASLGPGRVVATASLPAGGSAPGEAGRAAAGSGQPLAFSLFGTRPVLRLRFMTRDGTTLVPDPGGDPKLAGTTQETEILGAADKYAEAVWLQIRAEDPDDPTKVANLMGEVGIRELPDDSYDNDTKRLYNGEFGSTKLDESGRIGGATNGTLVSLVDGKVTVRLASVSGPRVYRNPAGVVDSDWPYSGPRGAHLEAVPGPGLAIQTMGPLGQQHTLRVAHWVDERDYERRRLLNLKSWAPNGGPNGVRDWLERKFWDTATDAVDTAQTGTEVDQACSLPATLVEGHPLSEADAVAMVFSVAPTEVQVNPTKMGVRRPNPTVASMGFNYGFWEVDNQDPFPRVVVHEARHCWQYAMAAQGADTDGDILLRATATPTGSEELIDDAHVSVSPGGNGERNFLGDSGPPSKDPFPGPRWMLEHNAMRFTSRAGLSPILESALRRVAIERGDNQRAPAGTVLPIPFEVKVFEVYEANLDAQGNVVPTSLRPSAAVPVRFRVVTPGSTAKVNSASEVVVMTALDGKAAVTVTNGANASLIQATILMPMAPQNGSRFMNQQIVSIWANVL